MTHKGYFIISHLIIKWPTISSYPNLHQLNYEMPLFYANSGNIASLTFQPRCLSIRPAWSINLRAVPELDSAANKPRELILRDPWRWGGGQREPACFWRRLLWPPEGLGWRCPRAQVVQEDSGFYPLENSVWECVCVGHVQELQGCPPCAPGDAMGWWFCAGAEEPPVPLWWAGPSQGVGNRHGNLQSSYRDSLSTPLLLLCIKEMLVPPTCMYLKRVV